MTEGIFGKCVGAEVGEEDRGVVFNVVGRGAEVERWQMLMLCAPVIGRRLLTGQIFVQHG